MVGPIQEVYNISKLIGPMLLKFLQCKQKNQNKEDLVIKISFNQRNTTSGVKDDQGISNVEKENSDGQEQGQTCRICLEEGNIPIYGNDVYEDVSQYIGLFGGINLSENDDEHYPKYICNSCNMLLEAALLLRNKALKSDKILRQASDDLSDVSNEYDTINVASSDDEDVTKKRRNNDNTDFETTANNKVHWLSKKNKVPKRSCPICKENYTLKYLHKHLALHRKGLLLHLCDVCGKKFRIKDRLVQHRKLHFEDDFTFKCTLCSYKSRSPHPLTIHMQTHTGEKPLLKCFLCPTRIFRCRSHLDQHMLTHKGDNYYKCPECLKGFRTKKNLQLHYKVDHASDARIKDHECNICGKMFGLRKHVLKHQLRVHKTQKMVKGSSSLQLVESKD